MTMNLKGPASLRTIALSRQAGYSHISNTAGLDAEITRIQRSVDRTPPNHPILPYLLENLASSFQERYDITGNTTELNTAITHAQRAVDLVPPDHPGFLPLLDNLAQSLLVRYERTGENETLDKAVTHAQRAVNLAPPGHPTLPILLDNLASCLYVRYTHAGVKADLETAIRHAQRATELTPPGHPNLPSLLNNLALSLTVRYEYSCEKADLDIAITHARRAVYLTPHDHQNKAVRLHNLALSLRARYQCTGQKADLDTAITHAQQAVDLTPVDHPNLPIPLDNLAASLRVRYECTGDEADLDMAITYARQAVGLIPPNHPNLPIPLDNLASCLHARYTRTDEKEDLDMAITYAQQAVDLTPSYHPNKPTHLGNLALSLRVRYERVGESADLDMAITHAQQAIDLTHLNDPNLPHLLDTFASSLRLRYEQSGNKAELDMAITHAQGAVNFTPSNHLNLPTLLNNLAVYLTLRCELTGDKADVDVAITDAQQAVNLNPDHPYQPTLLNNLVLFLQARDELIATKLKMHACVVLPQVALDHAVACESSIKMVLKPVCTTADAAYIIQAGFNEDILHSSRGALQEIYIFLNFDIRPTDEPQALDELSRILSPFPCTVHTPSVHRQLSIVETDGSIAPPDKMWALFRSSGIYTPEDELLAEGHLSPAGMKAPVSVEIARLNDETSSGSVDRANGTGQTPGDAREPVHGQLGLPSTPRHDGSAHSGDNNRRDGGLAPVGGATSSPPSSTSPRTPSLLIGDDGRGPDPGPPATAKQNCLASLDIPFSTSLKVKWTGEPNTSQEFITTSRLFLEILDPEDNSGAHTNKESEFSGRSLDVGFRLLEVSTEAEADSPVQYNLDLARVWISASLRPAFIDWDPSTTPGRGDTVKQQETSDKSHGLSLNIAQKPGVSYTHTRGTTTGREFNENLSKIHANPRYSDDKQTSSMRWIYDIDDEHQRQAGRRFRGQQLPWVKFGLDDPNQRPRVGAGLLVTWSLPIAIDQKEPRFPLSLFSSKRKPQPAFRNFLQKVTVSVPLEGLVGKCRTRNAVLSGTSDAPKLMAVDGEQCRDTAAETALDTAGFEVLHVEASFDAALFGCVQSADLERLGNKFSNAVSIV